MLREEHAVIIAAIVMNLNDHIFLIYPLKLKKKSNIILLELVQRHLQ